MLHTVLDPQQRGACDRDRVHTHVVALERLYECLGHAVAFGAFDRHEARLEIQGGGLKSATGGEDRAIVRQPLHLAWSPDVAESLLAQCTIMSRIISSEIPAVVVTKLMASRSRDQT